MIVNNTEATEGREPGHILRWLPACAVTPHIRFYRPPGPREPRDDVQLEFNDMELVTGHGHDGMPKLATKASRTEEDGSVRGNACNRYQGYVFMSVDNGPPAA